jgi:hypothetical protein
MSGIFADRHSSWPTARPSVHTGRVIGSAAEFEEATAFERWALEGLVPLPASRPHTQVKDLEQNAVRVAVGTAVVRVYAGGVREVQVDLRPLAFGAAWKVLDLLLELALSQAGLGGVGRIAIRSKVAHAKRAAGLCPPLTCHAALWGVLTAVYLATEEIRHSLVHRLAEVDRATGELTGRDDQGNVLPSITAEHQEAFCRAVQRAAQTIVERAMSARQLSDMSWNLDQLGHLHGQPALGGQPMELVPLGIAPTRLSGKDVLVDAPALLWELRQNFPDRTGYDATFKLPDGRQLLVELEQAPATEVAVDPDDLPDWAQLWNGDG